MCASCGHCEMPGDRKEPVSVSDVGAGAGAVEIMEDRYVDLNQTLERVALKKKQKQNVAGVTVVFEEDKGEKL